MTTTKAATTFLDRLNAAQKAWDEFDGDGAAAARVTRELQAIRPHGYLAVHGDGSCRVMRGEECLTPFQAVPEGEAIQLAQQERLQTDVRFRLADHTWFSAKALAKP